MDRDLDHHHLDLPANVATCLNPSLEYAFVKIGDEYHLMAAVLVGIHHESLPYRGLRGSGAPRSRL